MSSSLLPLDTIPSDKKATVVAILSRGNERRRHLDLGIVPGTNIKMLFESHSKNPKAYLIRGTVIAIRNQDANKILVKI